MNLYESLAAGKEGMNATGMDVPDPHSSSIHTLPSPI